MEEGGNREEREVEREVEEWRRAGTGGREVEGWRRVGRWEQEGGRGREGGDMVDSFLTCAL